MLGAESGQHPHWAVGDRAVRAVHQRTLLAIGDRTQALDGLVVIVCHHHGAGTAVVTPRERPPDRLQRRRPARRAVDPVGQFGGCGPLTGCQKARNGQRDDGRRQFPGLLGFQFLAGDLEKAQGLVGEARQFRLLFVVIQGDVSVPADRRRFPVGASEGLIDELAVLIHPDPADVHGTGGGCIRLLLGDFCFRLRFDQILRQHLAQHQVGVGTTEAEPGDSRDGVSAVTRPVADGVGDLEMHAVEVDIGIGAGVVDRRWNLVVVQGQGDLGDTRRTGRRFEVAQVGFDRTEQSGLVGGATAADDPAEGIGFDRVAEDGAGAMRLDVVDGARIDPGIAVGAS